MVAAFDPIPVKSLGQRAREVSQRLREATEEMNETICRAEDTFMEKLGPGARGRVELQRGETPIYDKRRKFVGKRAWVEFLIYREDEFFIESNRNDPKRFVATHILSVERSVRVLACTKLMELWVACGGTVLV